MALVWSWALALCLLAAQVQAENNGQVVFNEATKAFNSGDFKTAETKFRSLMVCKVQEMLLTLLVTGSISFRTAVREHRGMSGAARST